MPANLLAGEIGITAEGREYIFRPSFRKVAELGSPEHIVQLFTDVQVPDAKGFLSSLSVMHHFSVCGEEEAFKLLGYHREVCGRMRYVRGAIREPGDIQVLAKSLMDNAMIGKAIGSKKGNPATRFDVSEFTGAAVAHLGMSNADAWDMTMMEFQSAIKAKIGEPEEENRMTGADIDALWEEVDANG